MSGSAPDKVVDLSGLQQEKNAAEDAAFFDSVLRPATEAGAERAANQDLSEVVAGKAAADGFQEIGKNIKQDVKLGLASGDFRSVFSNQSESTQSLATSLASKVALAGKMAEQARQDVAKGNYAKLGVGVAQDLQSNLNSAAATATNAELNNIKRSQDAKAAKMKAIGTVAGGVYSKASAMRSAQKDKINEAVADRAVAFGSDKKNDGKIFNREQARKEVKKQQGFGFMDQFWG